MSIAINQPAFEWLPTLAYGRSYGAANALNQISSAGGTAVGWDADGNMTSDGVTAYSWTYGNRMSGASRAGMTATYDYDTDDRRTKKTVDGVVTRTLWSGADELAELDAAGNVLRRFVPDGTGAMDARLATVANTGDVYWLHTDHQGSVIATSDSAGQTVGVAAYSPFGEFGDGQSAPPQHSPFGYTGRQYDPETGLYQYRARYYSPSLGQFLSTDPIGTQDDPNLYMYVGLDPVNLVDPDGRQSRLLIPTAPPPATGYPGEEQQPLILTLGEVTRQGLTVVGDVLMTDRMFAAAVEGVSGFIYRNDRGDALGDDGRLSQDDKGKVHGNLPDADDIPDSGLEDSIGALEGSIGVRTEEQRRFPRGDPNGSPRERREARQRENHEERIRREEDLLGRLRGRND